MLSEPEEKILSLLSDVSGERWVQAVDNILNTRSVAFKGKKMPCHMGDHLKTVKGLVVVHIDSNSKEIWLSGPIPGSMFSSVKVTKTGASNGTPTCIWP